MVEAEELEKQLYAELEGLPKTGKQFVAAIRCILKRETRSAPSYRFHFQSCQQAQDLLRVSVEQCSGHTAHGPRRKGSSSLWQASCVTQLVADAVGL